MTEQNPYDEVPYGETAHPASHPGRAAALAVLLGLTPAPLEHCRVLELGGAGGSNLIPLACLLPDSQFVGMDYSARQIEKGQRTITALGLTNITLHAVDIRSMDDSWGQFDYIVAHGLYSWVPAEVREAVMRVCKQHLAPNGIAYLSYNTYPGWRMLQIAREAMLFRNRHTESPEQRAEQGRDFIQSLAGIPILEHDSLWGVMMAHYKGLMQVEATMLKNKPTNVLLHDELEAVNEPCYFTDFVEHAGRHGLEYLTEVDFPTVLASNLSPEIAARIQTMAATLIETEQYIDFYRNRTFRQTLLVHQGASINRQITPERLAGLYLSSEAAESEPDGDAPPGSVKFTAADLTGFVTADPFIQTMFRSLITHYPQSRSLEELADDVLAVLSPRLTALPPRDELLTHLAAHALAGFARSTGLVALQAYRPPFTVTVNETPRVSALVRHQLEQGSVVTAFNHTGCQLDMIGCILGLVLDGTRSHADLLVILKKLVARPEGESEADFDERLTLELANQLEWFARHALLEG